MEAEPLSEHEHPEFLHPAYSEINSCGEQAAGVGRMGNSLLHDLFRLWISRPDEWIHWAEIRDITYKKAKRDKTTTSDHVTKLGNKLRTRLDVWAEENPTSEWIIILDRKDDALDRAIQWKLIVKRRGGQKNADTQAVTNLSSPKTPEALFLPKVVWRINDYESPMPIWLPFDPRFALNFFINVCSEWPTPPKFPDYEFFKDKRWNHKNRSQQDNAQIDSPICGFTSFRKLYEYTSVLPVQIDAVLARYSDYRATNEQIIEWLEEGEIRLVEEFKTQLGSPNTKDRFLPGAANPISVIVNLVTDDNKIVFLRDQASGRWDSPGAGFLDPLQDVQRVHPFGLSPQETVIRMVYKDLGVAVHRQKIRWNALAIHREVGSVALLGEMNIGLKAKEVEFLFNKQRLNKPSPLALVDLTPESILTFFGSYDPWPLHFLEISVALSLRHRFDSVTVIV